jgi:hypothetical protein
VKATTLNAKFAMSISATFVTKALQVINILKRKKLAEL